MASINDWAFDVTEHVVAHHAKSIGFTPDDRQWYPDRTTGTLESGGRAVVIPKGVGPDNAARYRRWVTLPSSHWQSMSARPSGWRAFVLMVGLLPDGQPWWSSLYDEQLLLSVRDHSENMGGFYRFDPHLAATALVSEWDKDKPTEPRADVMGTITVYLCPSCRLLADFAPEDPAVHGTCPSCGDDSPLFVFDRVSPGVSAEERAAWEARFSRAEQQVLNLP